MATIVGCTLRELPAEHTMTAARQAVIVNPANNPPPKLAALAPSAMHLALMTDRRWPAAGVRLTVGFLDMPDDALCQKILSHMNAWSAAANVGFTLATDDNAQVRISRGADGYWSYLGTDILLIPPDEPTMNLEAFSLDTPDSEFYRVVRHETGHTLGFPHEHLRLELVELIDPDKAISYFGATQGWSADEVRAQVLTPLEATKLTYSGAADQNSIMCYQIPGAITKSGQPITGGTDIDDTDYKFAAAVYPKPPAA